jgi:hypothetical protein
LGRRQADRLVETAKYSSLAAFLAHYRALRGDHDAGRAADGGRLAAMEQLIALLRAEERAAIESDSDAPEVARHRERAQLKLRRELLARGVLDG